jgi:hypothetical protein
MDKIEITIKVPIPKGSKHLVELLKILQRTVGFFRHLLEKSEIT